MDMVELPSEEVRQMLRDSLRGFLGEQWRADEHPHSREYNQDEQQQRTSHRVSYMPSDA